MAKAPLGFGMMRLPVRDGNPTDIDYKELDKMTDAFLAAGFTYFDTSFVYHGGESETAVRRTLVERYPHREGGYTVATKFPTFAYQKESDIEPIFERQLQKLGVSYIDYYLLHNIQTLLYDGLDGSGGIAGRTHLFDHALKWRETGRIRHLGFSFHSSAKLLDRILTEHPETEFVQLAVNYVDWTGEFVQARECCQTVKRHGKKLVIMEPVKGGTLAKLPAAAADVLRKTRPDWSEASWALRFVSLLDNDMLAILSGMSDLSQMQDNLTTMSDIRPFSEAEQAALKRALLIFGEGRPVPTGKIAEFQGLSYLGVPVTALLDAYSTCQTEPNPEFSDILNYPKNAFAEASHFAFPQSDLPAQRFVLPDGSDATETVMTAVKWLKEHSF